MKAYQNSLCRWCLLFLFAFPSAYAGPLQRVPNTTLQMPLAPPTIGYTTTNAFPGLSLTNPLCFVSPPGETNRLFIVEKRGRIVVITNLAAPNRTVFMDIVSRVISSSDTSVGGEEGLLGMAFHPGYRTNNYFYVFYTGNATSGQGTGRHDILSRFRISAGNTNLGDTTSETRYIVQFDEEGNHNGGDMHFGEDGYLYVALGDEGAANDSRANSQRINKDYFAAMLRIDVDRRPGSLNPNSHPAVPSVLNYGVPADNPYIGATNFNGVAINPTSVRTEFWAVGLRNPWRFVFDRPTDTLYLGHVGQGLLEWVNILKKGDNAGWNFYEGSRQWTNPTPPGFAAFSAPLVEYGHTNSRNCIIGGPVYRGQRISQLYGAYIYADYGSGEVWALRHTGSTVTQNTRILQNASHRITGFGVDPSNGDILYAAARSGTNSTVERIIYNTTTNGTPLPPTLAHSGAFTNLASLASALDPLEPAPGIVSYDLNVPFWSDNAIKSRWFSVPNTNLTIGFHPSGNWSFPIGSVWIKHFNLELTNGVPSSAKRLETRLLVKNAAGIYGVVYRWGDSMTNATLVGEAGLDEALVINDGGILRTQVWHYPSRSECVICHTPEGGFALGFKSEQLHRDFAYPGGTTNQIAALSEAGYFAAPVTNTASLLALAHASNTNASLEFRARSYLAANCANCHQPGGSAQQAHWDGRISTPTALAGLINGALMDNLGSSSNRVIVPQATNHSVLWKRIATRDLSAPNSIQMPPLDSTVLDSQAIALVSDWISGLSNSFWIGASPPFQTAIVGSAPASFAISVLRTPDFVSNVDLQVNGVPAGVSAAFHPASVAGTNGTLSLTASNSAVPGTYALTITGVAAGQTNVTAATLVIGTNVPGTLVWSGASGVDTNWSTSLNWTNLSGGYGPPGLLNNVVFAGAAASPAVGAVNNIVDSTTTINALWYHHGPSPNTNHTTRIVPGATLNIVGTTNITGGTGFTPAFFSLLVGTNGSVTPSMSATITGPGGALNINNPTGTVAVAQFNTASKHVGVNLRAVLNLSGLDTFTANAGRLLIGSMNNGSAGTLYLARTNLLVLSSASAPQLNIADNNSNQGDPSYLYLGVTNAIFADHIATSRAKGTNGSILFNPAFIAQSPSAYFRGQNGASRVSSWVIADLLSANGTADVTKPVSTNDFTGGTVDATVDNLVLGKTTTIAPSTFATSNRISTGTLTFNSGVFDVNNLTNAWQLGNANGGTHSWDTAVGVINVHGGTLRVNDRLVLASGVTSINPAFAQGTLNVRNGTVAANRIINGGGTARITLTNATLFLTNTAGEPGAAINVFNLTNSTVHLKLAAGPPITNIVAGNLAAGGVTTLIVENVPNITATTMLPLISYSTFAGSIANFALGPIPAPLAGSLVDNTATKTLELRLTHAALTTPAIGGIRLSGSDLVLAGSNGVPSWNYYLLASTNLALPISLWTPLATGLFDANGAFQLTNTLDSNLPQRFYMLQVP